MGLDFNLHLSIMMLIFTVEMSITSTLFCLRLPRRRHFALFAALCTLLALAYIGLAPLESLRYAIRLPLTALLFVHIGLCYELDLVTVLFVGVTVYMVQCMESSLNSILSMLNPQLLGHYGIDIQVSIYGYLLIAFSYFLTLALVYFLFVRRVDWLALRRNARIPVIILCCVVFVMNHFWVFGAQMSGEGYNSSLNHLVDNAWNLVCCTLALCVQFGIFDSSRKEQELEITRTLMEQKESQYRTSKSMITAINRKCHQLKAQLGEIAAAGVMKSRVEQAVELIDSFDSAIHTGNEVLDILFTEKNFYCIQSQITFVSMIDGAQLNFMEPTDLYVFFGNIIDNAINTVRQLEDPARRTIYVNVRAEKQLLLVQTENPCADSPQTSGGLLHGFTSHSIRMIAEKYAGSVNEKEEDGVFYLNIVFPIR